ncbi:hypothetical protein DL764_003963 [Monosporascus ibericus]|uniref:CBM20 domain-containing protein n=1 Tax=Monosporascus ibericus TaxID=155417 RepID=A0A4Q4TEL3_9PEZI|nr:hypothetical protein DL764_003963 [Monosporascus ibericus]
MAISLFKQLLTKQSQMGTLDGSQDSSNLKVFHARGEVEIHVTFQGSVWGEWDDRYRGILQFAITFIQPKRILLQNAQVRFSFDCHQTEDECHKTDTCQRNSPDRRHRGLVKYCLPTQMYGHLTERRIEKNDEIQFSPNISLPSFGTFSLGSVTHIVATDHILKNHWSFESNPSPPLKYDEFGGHTDARFDWKENCDDREDYPRKICVGVVVENHKKDAFPLPLTLTVKAALRRYISPRKEKLEYNLSRGQEEIDLIRVADRWGEILSQNQPVKAVTFRVEIPADDNAIIKLMGERDLLSNWNSSQAICLHRLSNDGENTRWGGMIFAQVGEELVYKFIRVVENGTRFAFEAGDNHRHQVRDLHIHPPLAKPTWEMDLRQVE